MWAPKLGIESCRDCGTNERPHWARGLCSRCLQRAQARDIPYKRPIGVIPILTTLDLAYLAGLIDGEGTITLEMPGRSNSGISKSGRTRVMVTMTYQPIILWLHATLGGGLYQPHNKPNHKPALTWTLGGHKAVSLLLALHPYLRVKRAQADVAIEFGAIQKPYYHLGKEYISLLNVLKWKMTELNKRGVLEADREGKSATVSEIAFQALARRISSLDNPFQGLHPALPSGEEEE